MKLTVVGKNLSRKPPLVLPMYLLYPTLDYGTNFLPYPLERKERSSFNQVVVYSIHLESATQLQKIRQCPFGSSEGLAPNCGCLTIEINVGFSLKLLVSMG